MMMGYNYIFNEESKRVRGSMLRENVSKLCSTASIELRKLGENMEKKLSSDLRINGRFVGE